MFLKTLQIKGFKSFADVATLNLEPGVTVVVGPNGSGKSNVVDAIGWVLGAQAPSAVRSQKMDDVIFAGTSKLAQLGRAEVSLTIDNSAGLLPIEFTEVTITRLLFRNGDSEYSINGVNCRLLDIQELLSDSGVGRQQHVIISQGNIDAVLNARPEERRLIIEEAAGVLKFRRRKERAERRLHATEANLTRINDLLREVRRQLRPLERQADAARRHGDLVGELTSLRIHLAGRDLARLREQLEASSRTQAGLRDEDHRLRAVLSDLDARIVATEAQLSALGGRDLGDALTRYERLGEKARGQLALLAERHRNLERELDSSVDSAVIASLESEQHQLEGEARGIEADGSSFGEELARLEAAEAALSARREAFDSEWGEGVPAPSGEAAAVRGELAALRAAVERTGADRDRLAARQVSLLERVQRLERERAVTAAAVQTGDLAEPALVLAADAAATRRTDAEAHLVEAERAAVDAESETSAWSARAEALALALDDARQRAGAERLAGLDGVLGTLLDLVEVDDGWEEAFEAAAGEALGAVVVSDVDAGRRALDELEAGDQRGAVLALGAAGTMGATRLAVSGGEPVRSHVRAAPGAGGGAARAGIDALLDRLLATAHVPDGGMEAAVTAALADAASVVVTRRGDRFASTGWRLRAAGAGATGAALDEARSRADRCASIREVARGRVDSARAELAAARQAEQDAQRARDQAAGERHRVGDRLDRLEHDLDEARAELEALGAHLGELVERLSREEVRVSELTGRLPELEAEEAELGDRARRMSEARDALDSGSAELRATRTDLEVRAAALEERRRFVAARMGQISERLDRNRAEVADAADRRVLLEARLVATGHLRSFVTDRLTAIEPALASLRDERRRQSEATREVTTLLDGLRAERAAAEHALDAARSRLQSAEVADAECRMRLDAATQQLRHDLDAEPDAAIAAGCPLLPDGVSATARVRELERELRAMGPINPLALQEFQELSERNAFLEGQLDDIRQSRRELNKVIKAVDEEIVNVFAAAYADVSTNFTLLFETLFPGGQGRLRLTEPDNLLETGIELEARPSGKNVRKLSLLSGGERSLTALAYLFAVFRSRPSPFYVMDEVEAALDDVNLHRFLDLIAEFRSAAQLIVVSHQKRTMEAADVLYGVTMEPAGSSRVVSERAAVVLD